MNLIKKRLEHMILHEYNNLRLGVYMFEQSKLDRINELARKSKTCELSCEEKQEQDELRKEYLKNFRERFKKQLDNIEVVD